MAWEHQWIFDKYDKKKYSKEEQIERFKRNIAVKKTIKPNPMKKGKVCITNGVENKFVLPDLPIPEGWRRGETRK